MPADLVVSHESDMMLRLGALGWSRVSLSRVTWNCGTPFLCRWLALCRRSCSGLGFSWVFDGICSPFLCPWSSGPLFPMARFLIFNFGPLFSVAHSIREVCESEEQDLENGKGFANI